MKRKWILGLTGLLFIAFTTGAVGGEEPKTRALSLEDCIQMALQHNLEVQIERHNPVLAQFGLRGAYGAYEPTLGLFGQHDYNKAGSTVFPGTTLELPGQETDKNTLRSTLGGNLPWGARYDLVFNATDTDGLYYNNTNFLTTSRSFSSGSVTLGITQPLLKNFWIDGTRLTIRVAKNRLKYSELGLKLRIMSTATTVEQVYYDVIALREYVKVQEKAVELAGRLVAENKKRVEVGAMAPLDEKQAEAQAAASQADLIAARNALAIQEHLLKKLITDEYSEWADVVPEPSGTLQSSLQLFDRQNSWSRGLTQRPEMLQAKLNLERAGIQLKYDYNQLFPQLDIKGGGGYSGSTPEFSGVLGDIERRDQPFYYFGGQFSLPLGNTTARNSYKASKTAREQALLVIKTMERDILVQIDDAIRQAQSNYERVAATRKAREFAEDALAAEQKKLENGKSTTYTVLQMQRDLTAARGNELQALGNYNKALSALSLAEGSTLDRLDIGVEVK